LTRSFLFRVTGAGIVASNLLSLSSCAVPLGPGYIVEEQQFTVRYMAASPPSLHLRATYRLRNSGDRELSFVEVLLPGEQSSGRRGLRVWLDEREVTPQPAGELVSPALRIPFDPPWPQKQRHNLVLEYELAPGPRGNASLAVMEESFHLSDPGAFPVLQSPRGIFAEGGVPPEQWRLLVQVPQDFRVYAAARGQGSRKASGETEYRFRISRKDFLPFVAAGRYREQEVKASRDAVIFWTFAPLHAGQARAAADRLAATFQAYRAAFGPIWKKPPPVRAIESSAQLAGEPAGSGDAAGAAFPAGALLNTSAFALGVLSEEFLHVAEHELAHTWFGLTIMPRPEAQLVLGEGLAEYATIVAAEARGGEAERLRRAARLLRWFDESRRKEADKPLLRLEPRDPPEQRVFGYTKGALLFLGLEDQYGQEKVRRALAHMVSVMRGRHVGFPELISALETETRQSGGDFFRLWLDQTGIPGEVRARYAGKE
jgi:hypothetical protein